VLYGLEFTCLGLAKLVLLWRLAQSALSKNGAALRHGLALGRCWGNCVCSSRGLQLLLRVVIAIITAFSLLALVANAVESDYVVKRLRLYDEAASLCNSTDGSNTDASNAAKIQADSVVTSSINEGMYVQALSEATSLLLMILAYIVVVPSVAVVLRQAQHVAAGALMDVTRRGDSEVFQVPRVFARSAGKSGAGGGAPAVVSKDVAVGIVQDSMQAAEEQLRHLFAGCCVILITFIIRAAFDFLNAYGAPVSRPLPPHSLMQVFTSRIQESRLLHLRPLPIRQVANCKLVGLHARVPGHCCHTQLTAAAGYISLDHVSGAITLAADAWQRKPHAFTHGEVPSYLTVSPALLILMRGVLATLLLRVIGS
jgi:hypothetical protein